MISWKLELIVTTNDASNRRSLKDSFFQSLVVNVKNLICFVFNAAPEAGFPNNVAWCITAKAHLQFIYFKLEPRYL